MPSTRYPAASSSSSGIGIGWELVPSGTFAPGSGTNLTTFPTGLDLDTYNYRIWGAVVSSTNINLTIEFNGAAGSVLYLDNRLTSGANAPQTSEMLGTTAGDEIAIKEIEIFSIGDVTDLKRAYFTWWTMRDGGGSILAEDRGTGMWTVDAQCTQVQLKSSTATGFNVGTKLYLERRRKVAA